MASLFNIDPNAYISAPSDERRVLDYIVEQAAELLLERDKVFLQNLQQVVQNGVAKAFGGK